MIDSSLDQARLFRLTLSFQVNFLRKNLSLEPSDPSAALWKGRSLFLLEAGWESFQSMTHQDRLSCCEDLSIPFGFDRLEATRLQLGDDSTCGRYLFYLPGYSRDRSDPHFREICWEHHGFLAMSALVWMESAWELFSFVEGYPSSLLEASASRLLDHMRSPERLPSLDFPLPRAERRSLSIELRGLIALEEARSLGEATSDFVSFGETRRL